MLLTLLLGIAPFSGAQDDDPLLDELLEPVERSENPGPEESEDEVLRESLPAETEGGEAEGQADREALGSIPAEPGDKADEASPDTSAEVEGEAVESDDDDNGSDTRRVARPEGVDHLDGVSCEGEGPCIVEETGLELRALPRSFSALYVEPSDEAEILSNAVSAFKPLHVFGVRGIERSDVTDVQGWYEVGFSSRRAFGWMRARDIVEWRQALLLEYTHPGSGAERRAPVVMFDSREALSDLVTDPDRTERTNELLAAIDAGERPEGVIGREPTQFLNIDETFYLLPVIDWEREEAFEDPAHYLQVFAAVPGARAEAPGEGTIEDENFLAESLGAAAGLGYVDIVFVLDMTGSMQPYIDAVKDSMKKLVTQLRDLEVEPGKIRFGLVGYRDNVEAIPELEWNVKNFTPELLEADDLLAVLEKTKAAVVSSDEWAEDVHGGFLAGINSAWRESEGEDGRSLRSVRAMMLIGDASGHDLADPKRGEKNSAGMGAEELNEQARTLGIYPYSIYLQDTRAEPDWARGQAQFRAFAAGGQGDQVATYSVSVDFAEENLDSTVSYISRELACRIDRASKELHPDAATRDCDDTTDSDESAQSAGADSSSLAEQDRERMIEIARGVIQAAFADYLGDAAEPPRDFLSWVHDYDLSDPYREALDARVMITRQQLDDITRQTAYLLDAMEGNLLGNMDFLQVLKQSAARTSLGLDVDPDLSFEDQEFLPRWIASMPYRSRVLAMSPNEFANLNTSERRQFQARIESKYAAYLEMAGETDRWFRLDEADDELQEVIAMPLSLLP